MKSQENNLKALTTKLQALRESLKQCSEQTALRLSRFGEVYKEQMFLNSRGKRSQ